MKIIIAPDSFKGSLDAGQVAATIADGICDALPGAECICLPIADGGEGTVAVMLAAMGGEFVSAKVNDPFGRPITAEWGRLEDRESAVIELAAASGLTLIGDEERDPLRSSTYGTGQQILHALDFGSRRILLGIGGSATIDGGAGILDCLGIRLLDASDEPIARGGAALAGLARLDLASIDSRLAQTEIRVLCDVENPLVGPNGAAAVFGPQKGATDAMVVELDAALDHYASIVERDLGIRLSDTPRCGAAGGAGAALYAAAGATLEAGIDVVLDVLNLRSRIAGCDLVVTGEGKMDGQTQEGKAPYGVARIARELDKPVVAVVGEIDANLPPELRNMFTDILSLRSISSSQEDALQNAEERLRELSRSIRIA